MDPEFDRSSWSEGSGHGHLLLGLLIAILFSSHTSFVKHPNDPYNIENKSTVMSIANYVMCKQNLNDPK